MNRMKIREAIDRFGAAAFAWGVAFARGGSTVGVRHSDHNRALIQLLDTIEQETAPQPADKAMLHDYARALDPDTPAFDLWCKQQEQDDAKKD